MYWCEEVFNNRKNEKFMKEIKKNYVNEAFGWVKSINGSPEDRNYILKSSDNIQKLKPIYEKAVEIAERLKNYLIDFTVEA